ncbi:hypothetical protein QUF58_10870 [Anaerolineales bacterium HSG24]|nr:hypothetical protein [Anaerolineales bacterium HSG24]
MPETEFLWQIRSQSGDWERGGNAVTRTTGREFHTRDFFYVNIRQKEHQKPDFSKKSGF